MKYMTIKPIGYCEHSPFEICEPCEAEAQEVVEAASDETTAVELADLPDPANTANELPKRSDGAVLFKRTATYLVFAGGTFGGKETFPKLEKLLDRDGVTVGKFTTAKGYGVRKREVGAEVVYTIFGSEHGGAHRMQAEGATDDIDLGGARGNVAADVILRDGEIIFDPPSAWDELTDKEEKILYCLETAGKWVTAPELAELVQAKYAKPGTTGGFSVKVVKNALDALVRLGEAEGPLRRKYRYVEME